MHSRKMCGAAAAAAQATADRPTDDNETGSAAKVTVRAAVLWAV